MYKYQIYSLNGTYLGLIYAFDVDQAKDKAKRIYGCLQCMAMQS